MGGAYLLGLAVSLSLAQAEPAPFSDAVALRLVKQTAAFARRKLLDTVRRQDMEDGQGHYVEVQWKDGKILRFALAVIRRTDAGEPSSPWLAQEGGWGVAELQQDRTLAGFLAALQKARLADRLAATLAANEGAAVADLRAMLSAQAAYQTVNAGLYGEPACLRAPWDCVPGYSSDRPAFLGGETVVEGEKAGYRRRFHQGPMGAESVVPASSGRPGRRTPPPAAIDYSGLTAFAVTAVPVTPGQTGVRGFCGDASGRLCFTADGTEPLVAEGVCSSTCPTLE